MPPCFVIDDIKTPKGYLLRGLWFGPKKPKRVIVWVHGLSSSAFSMMHITSKLADTHTAVLAFNNRGFEKIADVKRVVGKKTKWIRAGAAHEVFTDCVDDIQGAINFARKAGAKRIFLGGHSTGCQKSIYWAYKTSGRGVHGIILLAPVSDYAVALAQDKNSTLEKLTKIAQRMVKSGKKHELMPKSVLNDGSLCDAQRFLSLNTPESIETLFPYEQRGKRPTILRKVKKPILVLWAEKDEYSDRSAKEATQWFDENTKAKHRVAIISNAAHGFKGAEKEIAREIRQFMEA